MTSPNQIISGLLELSRELAALSDGLAELEATAVNAKEDYVMAKAKAYLQSEGTIPEREATTVLATHVERLAAELAGCLVSGRKTALKVMEVRIDVGRSAASALRAEMALDGVR